MSQGHSEHALRYDDVREGEIILTGEEKERYAKQMTALAKLLEDKTVKAKFKIEIMFGKQRSMSNPTPGVMSFWGSGTKLHGGGDEKLYLCPGARLKKNTCEALLLDRYNSGQGIVCPTCGTVWKHEDVIGELFFNMPMRKWADVIYKYYRLCEYNADIYLKHHTSDIRSVSLNQAAKATWQGTKALERVREKRARHIYPLRNIIKDTSAGADLLSRFYAFLVA
jgi:hypothetical protein